MKTVLVVDDERDLLSAVSGVLGDEGYQVVECTDGKHALEYLARHRPDLALIDVMMPIVDGRELLARVRQDARLDGLPVVMMSAVDAPDLDRGPITGFLKKPFHLRRLLEVVRQATA